MPGPELLQVRKNLFTPYGQNNILINEFAVRRMFFCTRFSVARYENKPQLGGKRVLFECSSALITI